MAEVIPEIKEETGPSFDINQEYDTNSFKVKKDSPLLGTNRFIERIKENLPEWREDIELHNNVKRGTYQRDNKFIEKLRNFKPESNPKDFTLVRHFREHLISNPDEGLEEVINKGHDTFNDKKSEAKSYLEGKVKLEKEEALRQETIERERADKEREESIKQQGIQEAEEKQAREEAIKEEAGKTAIENNVEIKKVENDAKKIEGHNALTLKMVGTIGALGTLVLGGGGLTAGAINKFTNNETSNIGDKKKKNVRSVQRKNNNGTPVRGQPRKRIYG